jgi:iron complex outermembrane receptor protein
VSTLEAEGLFGQMTYQWNPAWQIQLGLRYSRDDNAGQGAAIIDGGALFRSGRATDEVPTGKLALEWTPSRSQSLYAFIARGYKAGGINADNSAFSPEYVRDYELGWKSIWLDGQVRTQAGLYRMDYTGFQLQDIELANGQSDVVNAGNSHINGAEIALQSRYRGLEINGSGAVTITRLQQAEIINPSLLPNGGINLGPQCNAATSGTCFDYTPYEVNIDGAQNPYSPRVTLNVETLYAIVVGDATLRPRLAFSHTASQWASVFESSQQSLLPAHNLLDADIAYDYHDTLLTLWMDNVTNATYIAGQFANSNFFGAPRTFGVRVSRRLFSRIN